MGEPQFNLVIPNKSKRFVKERSLTKISKKCVGKVYIEDGEFVVRVPTFELKANVSGDNISSQLVLPLTPESYVLKGREKVFSVLEKDKGTCFIRTKEKAEMFPGLRSRYTTVCENWLCSGWVVRCNGKLMFDLKETIGPDGFKYDIYHPDEDDD